MDDSASGLKRLQQPKLQQEKDEGLPMKRYNTRSSQRFKVSSITSTETCPNNGTVVALPIRIRPRTHNLFFSRLQQLFFHDDMSTDDDDDNKKNNNPNNNNNIDKAIIRIGNIRLKSIYQSPNIYMIDQFLSISDIQYLFTHYITKFKFQRSFVDDEISIMEEKEGKQSDEKLKNEEEVKSNSITTNRVQHQQQPSRQQHRTSTFLPLNKQHDSRIASIEQKVATIFGCTIQQIEAFQLVRYQSATKQYFNTHHDLGIYDDNTKKVVLPNKSIWYQRRMITIFCYLNTVPPINGGATYFPSCCCTNPIVHGRCSHETDTLQIVDNATSTITSNISSSEVRINSDCETPHQSLDNNTSGSNTNNIDRTIICDHDGLRVYPVAGRALVFSNILKTGMPDPRTIHAGEPVIVNAAAATINDNVVQQHTIDTMNHVSAVTTTTTTTTKVSSTSKHNNVKSKYGLNIWICEN